MNIQNNGMYQSDCLVLLERIEFERVTMAYLDPPAMSQITKTLIIGDESESEETNELMEHLSFMTKVIQQIHRVLNERGNMFFHTEPRLAGDYKRILNQVFGRKNFRQEIILPNFKKTASVLHRPRMNVILFFFIVRETTQFIILSISSCHLIHLLIPMDSALIGLYRLQNTLQNNLCNLNGMDLYPLLESHGFTQRSNLMN